MQYGNFNMNKKRKGKKIIIAVICIAAAVLAVIFYIGITAGSGSADMERISSAVAENTALKEEISELNERIENLETEIEELNTQLALRPTPAPTTEPAVETPIPIQTPSGNTSPRAGLQ